MGIRSESGFTLIELLVVVAIIGILVAIAIPQFASYRTSAHNSSAQAQVRNLATSMEAYYVVNKNYTTTVSELESTGYSSNPDVSVSITNNGSSFRATAYHSSGNTTYVWDSASGGLQ